jgi:hypothetical protein
MACGWMLSDPNFRKEESRYFPSDDKRIEWQQEHSGYDLYFPQERRCSAWNQREFFQRVGEK